MRRKLIAAVTSGVLALTVMAALPTHAEAVSIWLDRTRGRKASRRSSTRTMQTAIRTPTSSMVTMLRHCSTTMRRSARPRIG